jgi:hypothetical protein
VLDGEVVCFDDAGRSSFRALQQRFHPLRPGIPVSTSKRPSLRASAWRFPPPIIRVPTPGPTSGRLPLMGPRSLPPGGPVLRCRPR